MTLETRLTGAQGSHDGVCDVMAPIPAARVATWEDEQCRGMLDDDTSDVGRFRNWAAVTLFLDLEGEALQPRHRGGQPGRLVLALAALGISLCALTLSPIIVHAWSSPLPARQKTSSQKSCAARRNL
jgi:hypothetical protein